MAIIVVIQNVLINYKTIIRLVCGWFLSVNGSKYNGTLLLEPQLILTSLCTTTELAQLDLSLAQLNLILIVNISKSQYCSVISKHVKVSLLHIFIFWCTKFSR